MTWVFILKNYFSNKKDIIVLKTNIWIREEGFDKKNYLLLIKSLEFLRMFIIIKLGFHSKTHAIWGEKALRRK